VLGFIGRARAAGGVHEGHSSVWVGNQRIPVVEDVLLMADIQALILQLQADWFGLHYLDRARRIADIRSDGGSIRQIAAGLKFSETNIRRLLLTLEAPVEYQELARYNQISICELARRGKAASRRRETAGAVSRDESQRPTSST